MQTNVLIVDDSKRMRRSIRVLIENEPGLVVCGEAEDGLAALTTADKLKPDVVLLDLVMPKLNGAETALVLKQMLPKIPIVLFTMFDEVTDALGLSVDLVLSKPEGFENLAVRLRQLAATYSTQKSGRALA
jgi:DNA-binding NarL/FixJ family response regulator